MNQFVREGENFYRFNANTLMAIQDGHVYTIHEDYRRDVIYLVESGKLNLPQKLYQLDESFVQKVLTTYEKVSNQTLGVLLSGLKGTGKSIMAKRIAQQSGLPVLIVEKNVEMSYLLKFFKEFAQPVCLIFDEFEKYFKSEELLPFLDGVSGTGQKIVIFTCNDTSSLDSHLFDRPSRIRYMRQFEGLSPESIGIICQDKYPQRAEEISNFIQNRIHSPSIDSVITLLEEALIYPDASLEELLEDLNIVEKELEAVIL